MDASNLVKTEPKSRPIGRIEKMVRVADEAYTMSFGTSALVEGPTDHATVRRALDRLAERHPLLRAAVDGDRFVLGEAAPIELVETSAPLEETDAILEASIQHQRWDARGPRARCFVVRHGEGLATIALAFDHLVSDGGSGVIALRDLLARIGGEPVSDEPIGSPGQEHFLPPGRGGTRDLFRSLAHIGEQGKKPKPFRLGKGPRVAPFERRTRIHRIRLGRDESEAVARFAKASGATVHGVLVGALALAHAELAGRDGSVPLRVMHPVDMRRYLASVTGEDRIGDAIGYYVSSVETDHLVSTESALSSLAGEVTQAVRTAKERGEPFLSAPAAGRLLVLARSLLGAERFRDVGERQVLVGSLGLTNLGALERLGMRARFGSLRVRSVGFIASPSVFGAFCGSASSFDGSIELVLHHVEPRMDADTARRLAEMVERILRDLEP